MEEEEISNYALKPEGNSPNTVQGVQECATYADYLGGFQEKIGGGGGEWDDKGCLEMRALAP